MMLASMNSLTLRRQHIEHRTEPRIVAQMEPTSGVNPKLKPTVFLPSALLRPIRSARLKDKDG
jgi:hypothetical protein